MNNLQWEKIMKIRVVSSREEIFTLNPNERVVHLAFRPSNKDIFALVETCPKIEVIQLPKSYMAHGFKVHRNVP